MKQAQKEILASTIAGIIAVTNSPGNFGFYDTIVGVILLCVVKSVDVKPVNIWQRLAMAGIYGLISILIGGFFIVLLNMEIKIHGINECDKVLGLTELIIWIIISLISFFVKTAKSGQGNKEDA